VVQPLFARAIARARRGSVRRNYQSIGGGSPQLALTRAQADALEQRLNRSGASNEHRVFMALRYTRPSAAEALAALAHLGIRRIVTVPLYPHFSRATTGSSWNDFEAAMTDPRWQDHGFRVTHVDSYAEDPLYLDAFADRVRQAWQTMSEEGRHKGVILFSAHGLPQKFVDAGDPYLQQIEATRWGLVKRLNLPNRNLLGFQSRTGPVRWIGPGTDHLIEELGAAGVKHLLVVPLSFVSDHIETLYEIDQLFAGLAARVGIVEYRRPDALNTHPLFIECLARRVEQLVAAPDAALAAV
jgi:ferrochelatase